jgi:tRNA (guanine-N7-)-methyltransferase
MNSQATSLRFFAEDWLKPIPLETVFDASRPFEIDVGCGKGRFLLARALKKPGTNFLGVDRMLRRIRKVDNKARRLGLTNVRLLRMDAFYAVTYLIPADSVSAYYILFPDPWPKKRHHDHRLFNEKFVDALHRTLAAKGQLHFSTDHPPYFEEVKAILSGDKRFEKIPAFEPPEDERTDFELYYIRHVPIGRCSFRKA